MKLNEACRTCLFGKNIDAYPADAPPGEIRAYQESVRQIIDAGSAFAAPQVVGQLNDAWREHFGPKKDFTEIKRFFNALMLELYPELLADVRASGDPLKKAVQYAMAGNFIDFAALGDVREDDLREQLRQAEALVIDPEMLEAFRREVLAARRLVLMTDNCGEIVTDKLLLAVIRELNPSLCVTVVVRGLPVVNDATMEDAEQVGMSGAADFVLGNGTALPGAVLEVISPEARAEAEAADVLIAKGQGNYEGLSGCGLNIFYIFLCKCSLFMERFGVPQFSGMLVRERSFRV